MAASPKLASESVPLDASDRPGLLHEPSAQVDNSLIYTTTTIPMITMSTVVVLLILDLIKTKRHYQNLNTRLFTGNLRRTTHRRHRSRMSRRHRTMSLRLTMMRTNSNNNNMRGIRRTSSQRRQQVLSISSRLINRHQGHIFGTLKRRSLTRDLPLQRTRQTHHLNLTKVSKLSTTTRSLRRMNNKIRQSNGRTNNRNAPGLINLNNLRTRTTRGNRTHMVSRRTLSRRKHTTRSNKMSNHGTTASALGRTRRIIIRTVRHLGARRRGRRHRRGNSSNARNHGYSNSLSTTSGRITTLMNRMSRTQRGITKIKIQSGTRLRRISG